MEGLIDTKNEYIEHLQDILSIPIAKKVQELFNDKKSLKEFQSELVLIKKWNNNIVKDEYKRIIKITKCKYFENLIKIIIITSIKIKIYEYKDYFDNIKIKIPEPEDFLHKCYINVSLYCWKNAYLFNKKNIRDSEIQNNLNIIEENIRYIIKKTLRDYIPINDILEQIQNNLTNNVTQFSETPKKPVKENIYKKEESDNVSKNSSEEETTRKDISSDDESEEETDESENETDESESESDDESEDESGDDSGDKFAKDDDTIKTAENDVIIPIAIYEEKRGTVPEIEKEEKFSKEIIKEDEPFKIEDKKDDINELFSKEEDAISINIKNEEDYKEEELSQDTVENTIINTDDIATEVKINGNDIYDNNIKHVSIEMPITKPKKPSFF
jgi:hypothetical protein